MPPKKTTTPEDVAKVKVEPGEQNAIVESMADKSQRARHSMAFKYWLSQKATPEEVAHWDNSSLDIKAKQTMLMRWLIWRGRNFNLEMTQETTLNVSTKTTKASDYTWMSREQMIMTKGENKTKILIDSKKLETRPCRVTGSEEPDAIEYKAHSKPSKG